MSHADKIFKNMCNGILDKAFDINNFIPVRPHWEDGKQASVIKTFGICNTYDLRKEFPAITIRKTAIKSASDEVLWIYQKKSNNVNDLNSHVWDQWADENGSIGKAYGYQIGQTFICNNMNIKSKSLNEMDELMKDYEEYPSVLMDINTGDIMMDQIDYVLYTLKHDPFSRRIMTTSWNVQDLHEMNLQPCAYSCTFNVTKEDGELVLNMILNQRSSDILVANNWNVVQYSILLMMIAQVSNMIPGKLMHVIADAHIYDKHVSIVRELVQRQEHPAPIVTLNPEIRNFYDFKTSDIRIEHYETEPQVKNIPVAI